MTAELSMADAIIEKERAARREAQAEVERLKAAIVRHNSELLNAVWKEREACANIADCNESSYTIAAKIRNRGNPNQ